MQLRWKMEALHSMTSRLECRRQKRAPSRQQPSRVRSMLKGITTRPTRLSATARDMTKQLVGDCNCLK